MVLGARVLSEFGDDPQWAFCALTSSLEARAYYDGIRARGIGHHAAVRQLGNHVTTAV